MTSRALLLNTLRPWLKERLDWKETLREAEQRAKLVLNSAAERFPILVRPHTRKLTVAITAHCNLRCIGCRYGRDFMPGQELPLRLVRDMLDDGSRLGVETVRLYGGEPLLHRDLPAMVEHARRVGVEPYVTTNGVLLRRRIGELYDAGLRDLTIGFYGMHGEYDRYVQSRDRFREMEAGVAAVRDRYGLAVGLQLNYLLMRPTCSLEALESAWQFAERYDMVFRVDLIHYSLPYFTEGPNRELQFTPEDFPAIGTVAKRMESLKRAYPERFVESLMGIRSIPDWLMKGPEMRVPCDARSMIWVGADGTVQLCYVTFRLGNLHEQRLSEILYTDAHRRAARDSFALNCPNCHCGRDIRIQTHAPSRQRYRAEP